MPRTLLNETQIKSKRYNTPDHKKRRAILRDTEEKFTQPGAAELYTALAITNHKNWTTNAAKQILPGHIRVLAGDWGEVTHDLSKATGNIYAVLNMANAYVPGGGYLEGMSAQEENMYRRTNCHFYVHDNEMTENRNHYLPQMTDLINGVNGKVYLDTETPRICIKDKEGPDVTGYEDLGSEDYFLFYELKSAADDLRNGDSFNEFSMRKKIIAQLDTLKEKKIRHVVLSAFGCGAFKNPAPEVARIYREELAKRVGDFDDVVFAVYNAGYGPGHNFISFKENLDGLPLNEQKLTSVKNLILLLTQNVNQQSWDKKGFVLPFFECFKKSPAGILQMRSILNSNKDEINKICELKKIAKERLANPPKFTNRDESVNNLYKKIMQIDISRINDTMFKQFTDEDVPKFHL